MKGLHHENKSKTAFKLLTSDNEICKQPLNKKIDDEMLSGDFMSVFPH